MFTVDQFEAQNFLSSLFCLWHYFSPGPQLGRDRPDTGGLHVLRAPVSVLFSEVSCHSVATPKRIVDVIGSPIQRVLLQSMRSMHCVVSERSTCSDSAIYHRESLQDNYLAMACALYEHRSHHLEQAHERSLRVENLSVPPDTGSSAEPLVNSQVRCMQPNMLSWAFASYNVWEIWGGILWSCVNLLPLPGSACCCCPCQVQHVRFREE